MKRALITGASSGIGKELVKLLAKDGYDLVLVSRNKDKLDQLKYEIEKEYSVDIYTIAIDLIKEDSALNIYNEVKSKGLDVDLLVNNAGFGDYGYFIDSDINKAMDIIRLNEMALVSLTYYFIKDMKERSFGRVVNIASIASFMSGPMMSIYYASKAFVLSFSESLNEELKGSGIKVTTICPGPTDTNFFKNANAEASNFNTKSAKDVALVTYKTIKKDKSLEVVGLGNKLIVLAVKFLPRKLVTKLVYKVQSSLKRKNNEC